jgi:hypothetical protein
MVAAGMRQVLIDYSSAHHDLIQRVSLHEAAHQRLMLLSRIGAIPALAA